MSRRTARKTRPPRKTREPREAWPPGNSRNNGNKGRSGSTGQCGTTGTKRLPGEKGQKGDKGRSISAPFFIEGAPLEKKISEGQTAILKCAVDGYPQPRVTWSKNKSSLPIGRHVTGPSNALVIKKVKPEDTGIYTCSAVNMLGSANASSQLTVQCKCHELPIVKQATN